MLRIACFCLLALIALPAVAAEPSKYWVYFGTYTGKGASQGIYRSEMDAKTGKLTEPVLAAEVGSPSFLHIGPGGKTLYAVGEGDSPQGGGVYAYALTPKTGELKQLSATKSGGNGACHISTDHEGKFLMVSNYGAGSYAFFSLKSDGSIEKRIGYFAIPPQEEKGKPRKALGHCGFFDATGTVAFGCNAGQDKVHLFKIDREKGTVSAHDPAFVALPAGSAPRHIHIAPSNTYAFVNGERDMTVHLLKFDLKSNTFEVAQSLSTLPAGEQPQIGKHSTAEVRIHPNGKFVYVSNRGHNTIGAFQFDQDALKLTPLTTIRGDIKTPRNFNITPCGQFMLIASQDGGKVGVYRLDGKTGLAQETDISVKISRCVCVKFLAQPE
jgi:6-phosphogluconolactonase